MDQTGDALISEGPPSSAAAEHFENLEQQEHAAHLGMWLFLTSEVLLFGALFGLYTGYRLQYADEFARRLPDARIQTVDGAGHAPHLESPAVVARMVRDFLA